MTPLPWEPPIAAARRLTAPGDTFVLLHTGQSGPESGPGTGRSYLALRPARLHLPESFEALPLIAGPAPHATPDRWHFGYLAYEFPALSAEASFVSFPPAWLARFETVLVFDHASSRLTCHGPVPNATSRPRDPSTPKLLALGSNQTRRGYEARVAAILEDIRAGRYYQANLTRKFYGRLTRAPSPLTLFERLERLAPAPFSALIQWEDRAILSASMEGFLDIGAEDRIVTRPIKGTAARGATPEEDAALAQALQESGKNRAENLMITDLMRHDLAHVCRPGSVRVASLCALETHPLLHHLVSTVEGTLAPEATLGDILRATLPPGSMTGAPKQAVVRRLAELEGAARGVYSGVLGWLGGGRQAGLSVVIRTLLLEDDRFEFQVGGGIVADSEPASEWRETLVKAGAMAAMLDVPLARLSSL